MKKINMNLAHEMAKAFEGDYAACLALAMIILHRGVEMSIIDSEKVQNAIENYVKTSKIKNGVLDSNKANADLSKFFETHLKDVPNKILGEIRSEARTRALSAERELSAIEKTRKCYTEVLAKFGDLTNSEKSFIISISGRSTLTTKQKLWLKKISEKVGVSWDYRPTATFHSASSKSSCQHEDLGSLGYKHGTRVKCLHCGSLADVW